MAAILVQEEISDLAFIFQKISNTVNTHTKRYPEFLYIASGLAGIKKATSQAEEVHVLVALNQYLKEKLSEYQVIKMMQHAFHQDVEALLTERQVNREKEIYLDFI